MYNIYLINPLLNIQGDITCEPFALADWSGSTHDAGMFACFFPKCMFGITPAAARTDRRETRELIKMVGVSRLLAMSGSPYSPPVQTQVIQ